MQKSLPFFKWYPADALSDIDYVSLDLAAKGLFHDCLNYSWVNDGLPPDPIAIARLLRIEKQKFMKLWAQISKLFPQGVGGQLRNSRQELEREAAHQKSAKASESVKHRYERTTNDLLRARALDSESESESESDTEVRRRSACAPQSLVPYVAPPRRALPASKLNGHGAEWSAALYARHPKKKDEALVGGALFRVMEEAEDPSALFEEIDRVHRLWCATFDWSEKNGRFAPVLAAWLMDHGWTKEPHEDRSELERMMDRI